MSHVEKKGNDAATMQTDTYVCPEEYSAAMMDREIWQVVALLNHLDNLPLGRCCPVTQRPRPSWCPMAHDFI